MLVANVLQSSATRFVDFSVEANRYVPRHRLWGIVYGKRGSSSIADRKKGQGEGRGGLVLGAVGTGPHGVRGVKVSSLRASVYGSNGSTLTVSVILRSSQNRIMSR